MVARPCRAARDRGWMARRRCPGRPLSGSGRHRRLL